MGWHIVITEEMRAMGLSGNDLVVFALINGFSQDGQGCFYGSLSYICETCGIARRTALYILQDLVERGIIIKTETIQNGVKTVSYQVSANNAHDVQKLHRGSANNAPNNKVENINININDSIYKEPKFNFKKSLLEIGVTEEVADAWLQVRKTKKATNTKIAFDKVHSEILKSGLSSDECIRKSVENSWSGFRADWLQDQRQERKVPPKERKEKSVLEHNLKVYDEMFGTNMHEQAYGKREVYDEQ